MRWYGSGSKEEIQDTNRRASERVHNTKHESRGVGKETRGSEERQKRSGIGGRVSEQPEGAEIVGKRGKRGEKGDIITVKPIASAHGLGLGYKCQQSIYDIYAYACTWRDCSWGHYGVRQGLGKVVGL